MDEPCPDEEAFYANRQQLRRGVGLNSAGVLVRADDETARRARLERPLPDPSLLEDE